MGSLNKLWLRLMGIGEEEEADLSRRGFLKMLGGAAVVAAAPTYVFAPSGGWNNGISEVFSGGLTMRQPLMYSTARDLNDFIVPMLTDNVFKSSPIFERLKKSSNLPPYVFDLHQRLQIDMTRSFKPKRFRTRRALAI